LEQLHNVKQPSAAFSFRQENILSQWLNYSFCPPNMTPALGHAGDLFKVRLQHSIQTSNACQFMLRQEHDRSLLASLLTMRQVQEDAVRQQALILYHSDELADVRERMKAEIARGRLAIREDRNLYAGGIAPLAMCFWLLF